MKKSFIIHLDSLDILDELSMDQAGELFCAMRDYNLNKPVQLTGLMKVIFISFKNQFDRDLEKYKIASDKNKENGSKGGRPAKETQQNPVGYSGLKNNPNKADNDNDNVSVNDNENVNVIEKENVSKSIIKTIDIEERKLSFADTIKNYLSEYDKNLLLDFYHYWSEENQTGKKMRYELEKTWNLQGRLRTWKKNERPKGSFQSNNFNQPKPDKMEVMQNEYQKAMQQIYNQNQ